MSEYYDKEGNPLTTEEYRALQRRLGDKYMDYVRVAETTLPDGMWVSTIWLGMDLGFDRGVKIFETVVFPKRGDLGDLDRERYATLEEAKEGHEAVVKKWTKTKEDTNGS